MKVSVCTPSHRPSGLAAAYRSLCSQTYQAWEWLVLPNGERAGEVAAAARAAAPNDRRLRVVELADNRAHGSVGALKHTVFSAASGDLLVELDHDDQLTPDCLESLVAAVDQRQPYGFLYSDWLCDQYGKDLLYPAECGWQYYPFQWGRGLRQACRAFPVNGRALCTIEFSPNHVRAWTRAAYHAVGGHNAKLTLGDDHDLMLRTYLAGVPFIHIPKPLYVQHMADDTVTGLNDGVASEQSRMSAWSRLYDLVREDCRRQSRGLLRLGIFPEGPRGFTVGKPADLVECADLGAICLDRCLQRYQPTAAVALLQRAFEALAPGGWLLTSTPSTLAPDSGISVMPDYDPMAVSFWSEARWWGLLDPEWRATITGYTARWQSVRLTTAYRTTKDEQRRTPEVLGDFSAIKPGLIRWPGRVS